MYEIMKKKKVSSSKWPTIGDIVAEMAVDVALSDAENHTSERWEPAPHIKALQRDEIACPPKRTKK